ncbi:unnamed protein product [Rhodiola kirilowii]
MGESTCLLQSFSLGLDSGTPAATSTHCQLTDPMHGLGSESISFGRFMSDSLSWDKWSNFSHKRYVEEAASYSRPGSVAQKKAFFEEYYKRKALLAQENAAATNTQEVESNNDVTAVELENCEKESINFNDEIAEQKLIVATDSFVALDSILRSEDRDKEQLVTLTDVHIECESKALMAEPEMSAATTEVSEDSEMEKPLLKDQEACSNIKKPKPPQVPSLKAAANLWPSANIPCPPPKPLNCSRKGNATPMNTTSAIESFEIIRMSPKPLFAYMSRTPSRDTNQGDTRSTSKGAKDIIAPLRTPIMATQAKRSTVTPKSDNRRNTTPLESATPGNRTTGPKWRFLGGLDFSMCLSATCRNKRPSPTTSTPFKFKTEERAAKRKEKLELKFNATAPQKVQLQTKLKDKAENELKKLRQTFCFRARPLPSFYKERKALKDNLIVANPAAAPKPPQQARMIAKDSCKSLPPPTPQKRCSSLKNNVSSSATKKGSKRSVTHPQSLAAMISNENNSPNIPTHPPSK